MKTEESSEISEKRKEKEREGVYVRNEHRGRVRFKRPSMTLDSIQTKWAY